MSGSAYSFEKEPEPLVVYEERLEEFRENMREKYGNDKSKWPEYVIFVGSRKATNRNREPQIPVKKMNNNLPQAYRNIPPMNLSHLKNNNNKNKNKKNNKTGGTRKRKNTRKSKK